MATVQAVLPFICKYFNLRDLQALLCCQVVPLISSEMVVQRYQFKATHLLRLMHQAKVANLVCHICLQEPISRAKKGTLRQCARCNALLGQHCFRTCIEGTSCVAPSGSVKLLCASCAIAKCQVQDCKTCNCVNTVHCACSALVCSNHQRNCKLCAQTCCSICVTPYKVPILGVTYTLCMACAKKHKETLEHCARIAEAEQPSQ